MHSDSSLKSDIPNASGLEETFYDPRTIFDNGQSPTFKDAPELTQNLLGATSQTEVQIRHSNPPVGAEAEMSYLCEKLCAQFEGPSAFLPS